MNLAIIIPVYNEAENIEKTITQIEKEVKIPHKILVVYDFEEDNSLPAVKKLQKKYKDIKLVKNRVGNKRGVLNAVKTGFQLVKEGAVVVMMADLSDEPETINQMYLKISGGYDIVCGSRYMEGGSKIGGPFLKSLLSRLAGLTTPFILGIPIHDLTNAFRMYRKKVLDSIKLESSGGFELSMEILIKAYFKGFKISEVATVWRDRASGQSRFRLRQWLPKYTYWYLWGMKKRLGL